MTNHRYEYAVIFFLAVVCAPCASAQKSKKQSDRARFKEAQATEESSGGSAPAEFLIGDSYENGRGIPQDYAEAIHWYLKSAERGYAAAQVPLAWLYVNHGPAASNDTNLEDAYFWVDVALASGLSEKQGGLSKDGRNRALLLKKMLEGGVLHGPLADRTIPASLSTEQIAAAQARATKWFAERQQSTARK